LDHGDDPPAILRIVSAGVTYFENDDV